MKQLEIDDIEALALGAALLGTGGGGDPYHAMLNLRQAYAQGSRVSLVQLDELADEDLVAVVSTMGAPLVNQERLLDAEDVAKSVRVMEKHVGRRFTAVMAVEIGGANALQPLMAAVHMGIPVVDADCMGRAFPESQMTSFCIADLTPGPVALFDARGIEVVIGRVPTWRWIERLSRQLVSELGSIAATCKAPRSGQEVRDFSIPATVTQAITLGRAMQAARAAHGDVADAIVEAAGGCKLFTGKVLDIERRTGDGFLRGHVAIEGEGEHRGARFDVSFQNEWTLVLRDKEPLAMAPDLICMIDSDNGTVCRTDSMRYGHRVVALALPAPAILLTLRGMEVVGPRAFGHDLEFRSALANRKEITCAA